MQTLIAHNELTLELLPDERLLARRDGRSAVVSIRQAFPWSDPRRYLSLRDKDDEEFAFVADPASLRDSSRVALEAALVIAGFVMTVTRVASIEEEVEVRHWQVETEQGNRCFQTRLDDWPRALPDGGILVRDVAGDLYHVPDPDALDRPSRKLLWAFVD